MSKNVNNDVSKDPPYSRVDPQTALTRQRESVDILDKLTN